MTTDNTVQLTGTELEEYLAKRFPTTSPEMNTAPTAAFDAEWFRVQFADILTDVAVGDPDRDKATAVNMMEGFELAINDWLVYHEDALKSYRELHARFLGINRD